MNSNPQDTFMELRWLILVIFFGLVAFKSYSIFDVSSQGDASDTYPKGFRGGGCTIETGAFPVGFTAYMVPGDYMVPEQAIEAPPISVLCNQMPAPGILNITVDLLVRETRNIYVALSLVRIDGDREDEIMSLPAAQYTSGIISHPLRINEAGQYAILLRDGREEMVRIPLQVGGSSTQGIHLSNHTWGLLLFVTGYLMAYLWWRKIKRGY